MISLFASIRTYSIKNVPSSRPEFAVRHPHPRARRLGVALSFCTSAGRADAAGRHSAGGACAAVHVISPLYVVPRNRAINPRAAVVPGLLLGPARCARRPGRASEREGSHHNTTLVANLNVRFDRSRTDSPLNLALKNVRTALLLLEYPAAKQIKTKSICCTKFSIWGNQRGCTRLVHVHVSRSLAPLRVRRVDGPPGMLLTSPLKRYCWTNKCYEVEKSTAMHARARFNDYRA
ncbi:hypothetical protein EVAR_35213_1 [Eumeta japonica]|uniref:Uncharacterized protein n=1 Tax=Eumeta variegata TaxID=151549 RepID=A0A4C1VDE7_EUMVA|nr:hypothetical protein EVAR_35213_1 [Eumeta japonica]